jgi:hypothetical protein
MPPDGDLTAIGDSGLALFGLRGEKPAETYGDLGLLRFDELEGV